MPFAVIGVTPIAEQDAVLITGACPGPPYEVVRDAKSQSGLWSGSHLSSSSTSIAVSIDRLSTASTS